MRLIQQTPAAPLAVLLIAWGAIFPVTGSGGTAAPASARSGTIPPSLTEAAVPPLRVYTIKMNDNLWNLAGAFFGKPWLWSEFLKFNSIANPDLIYPGRILLVPRTGVLEDLQGKSEEEARRVREDLQSQSTPVPIEAVEPTPEATPVAAPVEPEEPAPLPTVKPTPSLKVSGSKSVNLSYGESRGTGGAGLSNTGYDRHESLRLNVEGQLHEKVKLQGRFNQSDLAEEDEYELTLSTKRWEGFFGNFQAALGGSQYLSSGMASTGVRIKGTYDRWNLAALFGTPRGRPEYRKFFGNNTQGPYDIPGAPLVPGTETVWVNQVRLSRGTDYELENVIGRITFKNRILQPVDLVEVQFESRSALYDTQVYGYRAEWTPWKGKAGSLRFGQGWIRQKESPDAAVATATARAAADTNVLAVDTTLDLGTRLKLGAETAHSLFDSLNEDLATDRRGGAYRLSGEGFRGPLHVKGQWARTESDFRTIGNPLTSNDYREWSVLGDLKPGDWLFAQADRSYRNTRALGPPDENFTDHGQLKFAPWGQSSGGVKTTPTPGMTKTPDSGAASIAAQVVEKASRGGPEMEYVYYRSEQERDDPVTPFQQENQRHTGSISTGLPGSLVLKSGGEWEERRGSQLGVSRSRAARSELSSSGWKGFNFSASGEWKLTDVAEASSNTSVSASTVGDDQPSQSYNLTMEGKPFSKLTLTAKGAYTSDPPGPPRANASGSWQAEPFKELTTHGNYTLEFQQKQTVSGVMPGRVHTGSGALEAAPLSWAKLAVQPSFRLEVLAGGGPRLSESARLDLRANLTPKWASLTGGQSLDRFATWDANTVGAPLNFFQKTAASNVGVRKPLGKGLSLEASGKRSDQRQDDFAAGIVTQRRTLTWNSQEALNWTVHTRLTLTATHNYNQLRQDSPGSAVAENPLLPYGPDTLSSTYPTNSLNVFTKAHGGTGRITEQVAKALSVYQEAGFTRTRDVIRAGLTDTLSPAAGFTWRPAVFMNWTSSYQFNRSRGQVRTEIQKAQTTLSASLNQTTQLSVNWNWSRAIRPFILNQQGTMSFTMNF